MVDAAVVAAVVVVGAGADQRVLGRLGVEVVGAGRHHRGGVQRDGGPRCRGRLEKVLTFHDLYLSKEESGPCDKLLCHENE